MPYANTIIRSSPLECRGDKPQWTGDRWSRSRWDSFEAEEAIDAKNMSNIAKREKI